MKNKEQIVLLQFCSRLEELDVKKKTLYIPGMLSGYEGPIGKELQASPKHRVQREPLNQTLTVRNRNSVCTRKNHNPDLNDIVMVFSKYRTSIF